MRRKNTSQLIRKYTIARFRREKDVCIVCHSIQNPRSEERGGASTSKNGGKYGRTGKEGSAGPLLYAFALRASIMRKKGVC